MSNSLRVKLLMDLYEVTKFLKRTPHTTKPGIKFRAFLLNVVYTFYNPWGMDPITKDLPTISKRRLIEHNNGEEEYTRKKALWKLVWHAAKTTRSEAYTLERKLKNITSIKRLESFIQRYSGPDAPDGGLDADPWTRRLHSIPPHTTKPGIKFRAFLLNMVCVCAVVRENGKIL